MDAQISTHGALFYVALGASVTLVLLVVASTITDGGRLLRQFASSIAGRASK